LTCPIPGRASPSVENTISPGVRAIALGAWAGAAFPAVIKTNNIAIRKLEAIS